MKIDRMSLKAAIKRAEKAAAGVEPNPTRWSWKQREMLKCGYVKFPKWTWTASERQIFYAIAAQSRGRLSIKKMWIPLCDATGGRQLVEFTQEMQVELIGDAWKEFELPGLVLPQVGEPSAVLVS